METQADIEVRDFLRTLLPSDVPDDMTLSIAAIKRLGNGQEGPILSRRCRTIEGAVQTVHNFRENPGFRYDIYFAPTLLNSSALEKLKRLKPKSRGGTKQAGAVTAFIADIDVSHPTRKSSERCFPSRAAARSFLDSLEYSPTIIVDSGHGYHCYWPLDQLWLLRTDEDRRCADQMLKAWERYLSAQADGYKIEQAGDLAALLRVPGTSNHKKDSQDEDC